MDETAEQAAMRDVLHEVAVEEIRPRALACDRDQTFPEDVWDRLAELDVTGMAVPEAHGGLELDRRTACVVFEEVAYGMLAVSTALGVHGLASACIASFADDAVQEAWLPEMATGRPVGAFALSEPQAGSNPREMTTAADPVDGGYELTGTKQWITNGARAGVVIVFARADPDDPDSVTQFLVPADADGLEVARKEDKLGLRASDTCQLTFDGVFVPERHRLTEAGRGLRAAFEILNGGRIAIAAQAVGVMRCARDDAVAYALEREQFDRPIAEFQAIRHKLADMETDIAASRLLAAEAARRDDAGEPAAKHASMAKLYASEAAVEVANEAVQIHGGAGYVSDTDVERLYRDAKVLPIYEGTSQIQRKIVARHVLDGA
ncbi:MAG: acyl-CoA dehydrogenase family protein [Halobacteriales archaeon]